MTFLLAQGAAAIVIRHAEERDAQLSATPQPTIPPARTVIVVPVPGLPTSTPSATATRPSPYADATDPDFSHDPFLPSVGIFLVIVGLALAARVTYTLLKERRKK